MILIQIVLISIIQPSRILIDLRNQTIYATHYIAKGCDNIRPVSCNQTSSRNDDNIHPHRRLVSIQTITLFQAPPASIPCHGITQPLTGSEANLMRLLSMHEKM